ncbi:MULTISPECIES: hypothetical protein [Paenibacillus]|uniref:bleomycin resistance protein n=1 Tax=Paenibacillus TaxID=44249 RepID=UPI002FE1FCA2
MSMERSQNVIPLLPCKSIDEQLDFYETLGFEITYRQAKPNIYACVRHSIAELHFFGLKQLVPAESYAMCYIHVPNVDEVYEDFCARFKRTYNKIPRSGIPRITRLSDLSEDRRFNLIDPAGNHLLIGQRHDSSKLKQHDESIWDTPNQPLNTYEIAYRLAYSKDDHAAASKVLDKMLASDKEVSNELRYKALILRADLAFSNDDPDLAEQLLTQAKQLTLTDQEFDRVSEDTDKMNELLESLGSSM